jgi:hypothetical protein
VYQMQVHSNVTVAVRLTSTFSLATHSLIQI